MRMRPIRKRVLFLAPYLGDGGINTHMLTLGSELQKLGWEVAVCSGGPIDGHVPAEKDRAGEGGRPPGVEDYERAGISHFEVRFPHRIRRARDLPQLARIPLAMWRILRAVRRFRPALLHSHSHQVGAYARVVQLLLGLPTVSTIHNAVPSGQRLWASDMFLGTRVLAVSDETGAALSLDHGVDRDRVHVVPPGADAERFRPPKLEERHAAQQRLGIRSGQFALAFVGSLNRNKRPDILVDAVATLAGEGRDVVAVIAGYGPEGTGIRTQAANLGITERVRLLGYQDTRSVLWATDALVLPSQNEGFGLVVVEAMLSGVVVMCTPSGGAAKQLKPDVTGVLFADGDHGELARRVAELIDRPDQRTSMAARGTEDARDRFSSSRMARAVAETYEEVLGGSNTESGKRV